MTPVEIFTGTLASKFEDYRNTPFGELRNKEATTEFKDRIIGFDHPQEAYLVTDLRQEKVSWSHGIDTWLKFTNPQSLPIDFITQRVHPFIRNWYRMLTDAAMLVLANYGESQYLKTCFVIHLPFKLGDGKYALVKQTAMAFEYDINGRLISFLSFLSVIGEYKGEPLWLRLYDADTELMHEKYREMESLILPHLNRDIRKMPEHHFATTTAIQAVRTAGIPLSNTIIAEYMKRVDPKFKVKEATANKYMRHIRDYLTSIIFDLEHLNQTELNALMPCLPFFLSEESPLYVIDYCEKSWIIRLLELDASENPTNQYPYRLIGSNNTPSNQPTPSSAEDPGSVSGVPQLI